MLQMFIFPEVTTGPPEHQNLLRPKDVLQHVCTDRGEKKPTCFKCFVVKKQLYVTEYFKQIVQIMVGLFNIGLGPGRTSMGPDDLTYLGAPYWLGAVVNRFFNTQGNDTREYSRNILPHIITIEQNLEKEARTRTIARLVQGLDPIVGYGTLTGVLDAIKCILIICLFWFQFIAVGIASILVDVYRYYCLVNEDRI